MRLLSSNNIILLSKVRLPISISFTSTSTSRYSVAGLRRPHITPPHDFVDRTSYLPPLLFVIYTLDAYPQSLERLQMVGQDVKAARSVGARESTKPWA